MTFFIYILASKSRRLYTGVTNDLQRRKLEHRSGACEGFTKQFRIDRLVYYEIFGQIRSAIAREKVIKAWRREKRTALVESKNPLWQDLYDDLFEKQKLQQLSPALTSPGTTTRGAATQ